MHYNINDSNAAIGWVLMRMGPDAVAQGEARVPQADAPQPRPLTHAERRSLREDCGLSRREAAEWHGVNERTVGYWEDGAGTPNEAADMDMMMLRLQLDAAAGQVVKTARAVIKAHPEIAGQPVELVRYKPHDYPRTQQAREGLPHGAHNRLTNLSAEALARDGIDSTIVYRGAGEWEATPPPEGFSGAAPDFMR
ncbi:MAG: hypothetical protein Q4G24_10550 [Paracoccus sp. (in: a-proteobacteria)]|uniref:helix-turn-helix domain-containing protein n=1 Tax=Paracoccus sp. TaxID=267 RepID=UPI0026DEE0E7|nr:hypothetical protein [Paracoccus sp. (in: a-proteobacteria)]MDO5621897.1 hypothetical protein [Paracoccus sp. (in: a-proteobacteria)]